MERFNIEIKTNDKQIYADLTFNDKIDHFSGLIIFYHGFKGFKDWGTFPLMAQEFAKAGFLFLKFNGSKNGTSKDQPDSFVDKEAFAGNTFSVQLDDINSVVSYANSELKLHYSFQEIYLMGHSRGGTIALLAACQNDKINKVASWSALSDLSAKWTEPELKKWEEEQRIFIKNARTGEELPQDYIIVKDYYENKEKLKLPELIKDCEKPILLIHGTEDETVPVEEALKLKRLNKNCRIELIPMAGHTYSASHPWKSDKLPFDTETAVKHSIEFFKS